MFVDRLSKISSYVYKQIWCLHNIPFIGFWFLKNNFNTYYNYERWYESMHFLWFQNQVALHISLFSVCIIKISLNHTFSIAGIKFTKVICCNSLSQLHVLHQNATDDENWDIFNYLFTVECQWYYTNCNHKRTRLPFDSMQGWCRNHFIPLSH